MVKVYSSPFGPKVHLARAWLEGQGIASVVLGENLSGVAGGIAPLDAWVELWVLDDARAEEAATLLAELDAS